MPPKKKVDGPSKKNEIKKKEKIVEDKTFGLKNKKGAKQQKFISNVTQQVKFGSQSGKKAELLKQQEKIKKEDKKKDALALNDLFKPITAIQKIEKGADPKSVLCAFYKQGQCTKGDKCKFSHDMNIERKGEKRSMYVDMRDGENDTMENWDEETLRDVVDRKHAEADNKKPKTDIICKHFLDALEKNKYGWFWQCPAGEKCFYRHALPPGFVLERDKKKQEKTELISIEELVEKERASLGINQTKVTYETFLAWKRTKIEEKAEKTRKEQDTKKRDFKAGRAIGISGRDMFTFRPDMATEDQDDDDDGVAYVHESGNNVEEADEGEVHEITLEMFSTQMQASDAIQNNVDGAAAAAEVNVPIDEDLFDEDDEDLDEIDENLNQLDIDERP